MRQKIRSDATLSTPFRPSTLVVMLALLAAVGTAGGTSPAWAAVEGRAQIEGSFLDHPQGYANDKAAGIVAPLLRLSWTLDAPGAAWWLLYEGSWQRPQEPSALDQQDHAVSIEWSPASAENGTGASAGARVRMWKTSGMKLGLLRAGGDPLRGSISLLRRGKGSPVRSDRRSPARNRLPAHLGPEYDLGIRARK